MSYVQDIMDMLLSSEGSSPPMQRRRIQATLSPSSLLADNTQSMIGQSVGQDPGQSLLEAIQQFFQQGGVGNAGGGASSSAGAGGSGGSSGSVPPSNVSGAPPPAPGGNPLPSNYVPNIENFGSAGGGGSGGNSAPPRGGRVAAPPSTGGLSQDQLLRMLMGA